MDRIKLYVFLLFFGICFNGFSQDDYSYKRKINVNKDSLKWSSIELPEEIYDRIQPNLSDIRIYEFKDNDTIEAPYLHNLEEFSGISIESKSKLINQVKTEEGYYFTFEKLNNQADVSSIRLNFSNDNFDWNVDLQGSHNQNEWFTILEDYRILSIKNNQTDYRFENLAFNDTNYKYYKIFIKTNDKPSLLYGVLNYKSGGRKDFKSHIIKDFSVETDKKSKSTIIEFSTKTKLPVYYINILVDTNEDFHRPIKIDYVRDSTKTEKGWVKNYGFLHSGIISSSNILSSEKKSFDNQVIAKNFRITIENSDNQPLDIKYVELQSLIHALYFKPKPDVNYAIYYGNDNARLPQYDLEKFRSQIVNEPKSTVSLSEEMVVPKIEKVQQKPLFESKLWLWGIMILIIIILGYFSFKMLSKKE